MHRYGSLDTPSAGPVSHQSTRSHVAPRLVARRRRTADAKTAREYVERRQREQRHGGEDGERTSGVPGRRDGGDRGHHGQHRGNAEKRAVEGDGGGKDRDERAGEDEGGQTAPRTDGAPRRAGESGRHVCPVKSGERKSWSREARFPPVHDTGEIRSGDRNNPVERVRNRRYART